MRMICGHVLTKAMTLFGRSISPAMMIRPSLMDFTLGRSLTTSSHTGIRTMKLPIGFDNFGEIVTNKKLTIVDKSLFIKEVLDDENTKVAVITRPRRFGKTLNLSMLQHFLTSQVSGLSTKGLFDNLKIAKEDPRYMAHQGKYPVITLTFKDIRHHEFEIAYAGLRRLIGDVYREHKYLLNSPHLDSGEKKVYMAIINKEADADEVTASLKNLSQYLALHHGVKPWLLIDEYDTPLQSGYQHTYYEQMIEVIRGLFGNVLKGNDFLHKAVITGILRIAKESLFSEVNNLEDYSLLRSEYSEYFGFTEEEVSDLLAKSGLAHQSTDIKHWYNGYQIGKTIIYNPWSIVKCIREEGALKPYWVNTSGNALIKDLLVSSSVDFKEQFNILLQNKPIERVIDENIVFGDLQQANETSIWSLFLVSGYLKVVSQRLDDRGQSVCLLAIPNREIRALYHRIIEQWLSNGHGVEWYSQFLSRLLSGQVNLFEQDLKALMEQTVSIHDVARTSENFYQGLMLGFTASLQGSKHYEIISNRESGSGRFDYLIFSRDLKKPSILMEFKKVDALKDESKLIEKLEEEAKKALEQIEKRGYLTEAKQRGNEKILKIGLAFCGKQFALCYEEKGCSLQEENTHYLKR